MIIHEQTLDAEQAYRLLTGVVVPRPIAWISTRSANDCVNVAPFSAFTFAAYKPPMVVVGIGTRGGKLKDTARNIQATREFVVNICDHALLEKLHLSSMAYPSEVSEAAALELQLRPSVSIGTPSLAQAPISLECMLHQSIDLGEPVVTLFIGNVRVFYIRDDLYANGKVDTDRLHPIARLAGPFYAKLGEIIRMEPIGGSISMNDT